MSSVQSTETTIKEILWQALEGGNYDVPALRERLTADSRFDEAGLDSLDMVDFFLRVQDHFKITMREEDYARLATIKAVQGYVEEKSGQAAES